MASISKTPSGTYAVSYRVNGKQTKRTFKDKKLALRFRDVVDMDPSIKATRVTVADLMLAYRDKMSAKKRGARALSSIRQCASLRKPSPWASEMREGSWLWLANGRLCAGKRSTLIRVASK